MLETELLAEAVSFLYVKPYLEFKKIQKRRKEEGRQELGRMRPHRFELLKDFNWHLIMAVSFLNLGKHPVLARKSANEPLKFNAIRKF